MIPTMPITGINSSHIEHPDKPKPLNKNIHMLTFSTRVLPHLGHGCHCSSLAKLKPPAIKR